MARRGRRRRHPKRRGGGTLRSPTKAEKRRLAGWMRTNPTDAEAELWSHLRHGVNGHKVITQHIIAGYIVDFYIPAAKLVIEVDGSSHRGREGYDSRRTQHLGQKGCRVVRFTNDTVMGNVERVLGEIRRNAR